MRVSRKRTSWTRIAAAVHILQDCNPARQGRQNRRRLIRTVDETWRSVCFDRSLTMRNVYLHPAAGPGDHAFGPSDAPVVLVEYGDYECARCARAHAILPEVRDRLGDRLCYVFRNFPLTDIHRHARRAAEAAESLAAHGGADAFWDFQDILFVNQDALEIDDLLGYAEAAGVDVEAVAADLAVHAQRRRVQVDFESGIKSGVNAAPAFFVNGVCFEGNWRDADAFAAALREAAAARSF
jgi:protein-disulfide isomerase